MPGIIRNVPGSRTLDEGAVEELILLALLVSNSLSINPVVHPCNRPACVIKVKIQYWDTDAILNRNAENNVAYLQKGLYRQWKIQHTSQKRHFSAASLWVVRLSIKHGLYIADNASKMFISILYANLLATQSSLLTSLRNRKMHAGRYKLICWSRTCTNWHRILSVTFAKLKDELGDMSLTYVHYPFTHWHITCFVL